MKICEILKQNWYKVVKELFSTTGKNRGLHKSLDQLESEPKLLISKINLAEHRNTTVTLKGEFLEVATDIHLVQLKDDGELQLRFVSELNGEEISGEIWMQVNAELFGFDKISTAKNTSLLIGCSRTEKTLKLLMYLDETYGVKYSYSQFKSAFGLVIDTVEKGTSYASYRAHGTFKDGGKWTIDFDISKFSCTFKSSMKSLRKIENFPIFEFE